MIAILLLLLWILVRFDALVFIWTAPVGGRTRLGQDREAQSARPNKAHNIEPDPGPLICAFGPKGARPESRLPA